MPSVIIVRGLPGSGKSTFANSLIEVSEKCVKVEADDYFINAAGEYVFDPSKLKDAHADCLARAAHYVRQWRTVIVCNTFSRRWEFAPYVQLADDYGFPCHVLTMNGNHRNVHGVPDNVIERMRERWES